MRHSFFTLLIATLIFVVPAIGVAQTDWEHMTSAELQQQASQLHPTALYTLASKLFKEGHKDEAVFWFYVGQLRFRFHLKAYPRLEPSGEPAAFSALSEVVGRPINEFAFGDIPRLLQTLDRVLEWDERNTNSTTSKNEFEREWSEVRDGLKSMKQEIKNSQGWIKEQRKKNGLENRA